MISIVIPTYNIENYIDQTLNSVLNQTFKNYEVIVVDDCSTDKTLDVVKTFLPRFNGKLQIHQLPKNSNEEYVLRGRGTKPHNVGLEYSRGKYIFLLDGDDLITPNALEKLHDAAEEFQADMVSTTRICCFKDRGVLPEPNEVKLFRSPKPKGITEPTLEKENDVLKRAQMFVDAKIFEYFWNKLYRRDFLIEHGITIPNMLIREDGVFVFECYIFAKCVYIPDALNLYRLERIGSITNVTGGSISEKQIRKHINSTIVGAKEFYNFMQTVDELKNNPEMQYKVIRHYVKLNLKWLMKPIYSQNSAEKVFQIFMEEFSKDPAGFAPAIATSLNILNGG